MTGLLVLGTDTGVGKTLVAAGLTRWRRRRGLPVSPHKPVETGVGAEGPLDAALLAAAAGLPVSAVIGYALPDPLAPEVAAARVGVSLDLARMAERVRVGFPIVEAAGGALVRIAPGVAAADLAARWDLAPLLVAANRLGVLSHACLCVEALAARGTPVVAIALVEHREPGLAERTNPAELRRLLPGIPIVPVPCLPADRRGDPDRLADAVHPLACTLWTEA